MLAEAQTAQHGAHLGVESVAIVGAKMGVEIREAIRRRRVFGGCRVKLSQTCGEGFEFLLHAAQFGEDREALGENAAAAECQTFLRQIADRHATGALQGAVVERFEPARTLSRVDLPVPFAPTRAVRSLGVMSQSAFSNKTRGPNRLPAAESWSIRKAAPRRCSHCRI